MKKLTRPHIEKFIASYKTDQRIADIGSGGSAYGSYFPNRLTIDIDSERNPEVIADAQELPFADGEFPLVLCTEVLEHTKDPRKVAGELMRILAPGGTLVLTTRFVYPLHDTPIDHWRFTKYGLQELFSSWDIIEIQSELGTFSTIGALLQRIGFQTSLRGGVFTKSILYAAAYLFTKMDVLIREEYGDIQRKQEESNILSTGVYIAVRKNEPTVG